MMDLMEEAEVIAAMEKNDPELAEIVSHWLRFSYWHKASPFPLNTPLTHPNSPYKRRSLSG